MYYLNKIIAGILNPLGIGLLLAFLSLFASLLFKSFKLAKLLLLLSILWLWFWSMGAVDRLIGLPLERAFPPQVIETVPTADAIIILGGGIGENTNVCPYVELQTAADRVWYGARLYRAGKAPRIFVTLESDARFLVDFGIPRAAISGPSDARNTEEEARFIAEVINQDGAKVLLVTSACHMRRAKLMFDRYAQGLEVIPAATDHESMCYSVRPFEFRDFVPDPEKLSFNAYRFKEWIAYWGYRYLRN